MFVCFWRFRYRRVTGTLSVCFAILLLLEEIRARSANITVSINATTLASYSSSLLQRYSYARIDKQSILETASDTPASANDVVHCYSYVRATLLSFWGVGSSFIGSITYLSDNSSSYQVLVTQAVTTTTRSPTSSTTTRSPTSSESSPSSNFSSPFSSSSSSSQSAFDASQQQPDDGSVSVYQLKFRLSRIDGGQRAGKDVGSGSGMGGHFPGESRERPGP